VPLDPETHPFCGELLQPLNLLVLELDDLLAAAAEHMLVVFVAEHVLKPPPATASLEALYKSSLLQHRERPIDRRAGDLWVLFAAEIEQLLSSEVVVILQGRSHDQRALIGPPKPALAQVLFDDELFLVVFHSNVIITSNGLGLT